MRHLIPSRNGGMTVTNAVARRNREFDRQMRAGLLCVACAQPFWKLPRHPRHTDCCERCGNDFE